MGRYNIEIKKSAVKEIKKLPPKDLKRILNAIEKLADDPHPQNSKKLSAQEKYRLRVGDYRILYSIEDDRLVIVIVKVGHRREVYR